MIRQEMWKEDSVGIKTGAMSHTPITSTVVLGNLLLMIWAHIAHIAHNFCFFETCA